MSGFNNAGRAPGPQQRAPQPPGAGPSNGPPPGGPPMQPPQQPGAPQNPMEEGEPATPEEQAIYNRYVSMAILALYDDKMMPKAIGLVQNAESPAKGVADVASNLAMRVSSRAKEQGQDIPGDILLAGGREIVEAIVELVETAGVAELDERQSEAAFYRAVDQYRAMAEEKGDIDQNAVAQDIEQLREMERSGKLDQAVRAVSAEQGGM